MKSPSIFLLDFNLLQRVSGFLEATGFAQHQTINVALVHAEFANHLLGGFLQALGVHKFILTISSKVSSCSGV
jgi:hypothetical protein